MCRATPSPPSRWHFRASSVPTPGAWLEGRLQLVVGGSAACAGEPLVGLVALAAPAAPRADHRRAGGCSEGQEGPRRGVGCASARVCQVRGRGLGLRLVGLAAVAQAGECSQRGKLHEMASRSFHCDRLLPLPPPARPKPGSFPLRTCAPAQLGGRALRPRISPLRGAQGVRTGACRARNARPWASEQRHPTLCPGRCAPGTAGPALRTWRACTRSGGAAGVRAARGMGTVGGCAQSQPPATLREIVSWASPRTPWAAPSPPSCRRCSSSPSMPPSRSVVRAARGRGVRGLGVGLAEQGADRCRRG